MGKIADLHVHTNFSDGTFSPEEVVQHASKMGLDCIAICDHDVIDAIDPCLLYGEKLGVEIIPAVELTAEKQGCEIHMLGFYIAWKDAAFQETLERLCAQREKRIYDMVNKLKKYKIKLDPEEVFQLSGKGSIGRLHLARMLYKKGYVATVDDAFKKYIGNGKSCYVGKINLTPERAIDEIIKAGGIPVLAHPGVMGKDEFIPSYIKHGLMGIEVYHTDHPPAVAKRYEEIAKRHNLLVTGGSDCHGLGKGRVLMGAITIGYELVEKLKNARR
jgi:predicted metal-dependent phosphoesterase TrpH